MADIDLSEGVDELTGQLNWRGLKKVIANLGDREDAATESVGVIFADIDDFKRFNYFFGHHDGDRVLIKVAQRIAQVTPEGRSLARLGGGFVLLLPGVRGISEVQDAAVDILRAFDAFVVHRKKFDFAMPGYSLERPYAGRVALQRRLFEVVPKGSVLASRSGDNFELLLPEASSDVTAQETAAKVKMAFNTSVVLGEVDRNVRLSLGLTHVGDGDVQRGLRDAEVAMFTAKTRGKARAVCLEPAWETQ